MHLSKGVEQIRAEQGELIVGIPEGMYPLQGGK